MERIIDGIDEQLRINPLPLYQKEEENMVDISKDSNYMLYIT